MSNEQHSRDNASKADPSVVRTKDNPLGTDDIGLPADVRPEEARKPEEVRPDPAKVRH